MNSQPNLLARACRVGLGLAGLAALAACGGGGGDNVRAVAPPPAGPPPDPVVFDPDPRFVKHLTVTGADQAHAAGITGAGVRIGVVDSGVNRNHPALSPRVLANLVYISSRNNLSVDDVVGHGTAVSQVMAGTPFGAWPGGVAPGAEIVSARIIADKRPDDDGSGQGNEINGAIGLKPIHQDLINHGVKVMNNSWGGLYWTNPAATAPIADEYRPFVIQHGGLVVFSTGNSAFPDPSDMAALPSQPGPNGTFPAADLEVGWLAVAAVLAESPGTLASYSNACGVAMYYCLAAPGNVTTTGTNDAPDSPTYWTWQGTSFSAPLVSGAAALVWQAFPYFNNDLVRQTLLGTATDIGAPGVDPVFGYGPLNIADAIKGPGRLDWGQVVANFSGTSTWSNDISGAGGITKRGAGTLVLAGDNSYAGTTRVEGGVLTATHDIAASAVVGVDGGLALDGSGVNGDLVNHGTTFLYGGDANGMDHAVAGDFTQADGAVLAFDVGSHLQVAGTASLDGDAMVAGVTDGYVFQSRETFLTAAGGVTGTFDNLLAGQGVFLEATLDYMPNDVSLEIQRLDVGVAAAAMGATPVALGSATRIENAFRTIDQGRVSGLAPSPEFLDGAAAFQRTPTAAAAGMSLGSLSGELHAADRAFALMAVDSGRNALETRLDMLGQGTAAGAWADRLDSQRSSWSGNWLDSRGWVIGQDIHLSPELTVGVAFGQSDGRAADLVRADRERNRQVEGQLYGSWRRGDSYVLGRLATGRLERQVERNILLGRDWFGVGTDYANDYSVLDLQAGHRFAIGGATLTPYLGAEQLHLARGGFSEHGAAGFGLSTADSTLDATRAIAGTRLERSWAVGEATLALQGRVE